MTAGLRGQILITAGAVVLALVVGAVLMIVTSPLIKGGLDLWLPVEAYAALVEGALLTSNGWIDTLVRATPYILAGLSVGLCFKGGLFNIGAQGQFLMGALGAGAAAFFVADWPHVIAMPVAIAAGVIAGAAYGFVPGWLKAYTGAHEVVVTIMLNYIALQIVAWAVSGPLRARGASFARTPDVGDAGIPTILGTSGHELHAGVFIALAAVPIIWWILYRSTIGFEIRTVGASPDAARYAGMRPRMLVILTMTVGGLLAGLAGAIEILGVQGYLPAAYASTVGFDAITVALLGRANPIGILFAGLLLGALRAGAPLMQIKAQVPVQMIDILQGIILFFLAADIIVRYVFRLRAQGGDSGVTAPQTISRTYGGRSTP